MSKVISVKSIKSSGQSIKKMYEESVEYLTNIGFQKTTLVFVNDKTTALISLMFSQGNERVLLEFQQDSIEEKLHLKFSPMRIKFVHDILLMRFNSIAKKSNNKVFIFNS